MSTSGKPVVQLSAQPKREELREARKVLAVLAPFDQNAAAQLKAVDGMIRLMYPRRSKGSDPRVPTPNGRRRGRKRDMLIEAADCLEMCPQCRKLRPPVPSGKMAEWTATAVQPGTVTLKTADGDPYGSRPIVRTARRIRPDEYGRCRICGTALEQHGKPEMPGQPDWRAPDAKRIRGFKPTRGELAQDSGVSNPGNPGTPHHRGYLNGELVGPIRREERRIAAQYRMRQPDGPRPCGATAEDISAELEARATNALPQFRIVVEDDGSLTGKPLIWNRKKRGSRRDKSITIRGEGVRGHGASKADRRVKRYQAELDRSLKAAGMSPASRRRAIEDSIKALQQVGADTSVFDAMLAELVEIYPHPVEYESPSLAEARRRGDLPPDDVATMEPTGTSSWHVLEAEQKADRVFHAPVPHGVMR